MKKSIERHIDIDKEERRSTAKMNEVQKRKLMDHAKNIWPDQRLQSTK